MTEGEGDAGFDPESRHHRLKFIGNFISIRSSLPFTCIGMSIRYRYDSKYFLFGELNCLCLFLGNSWAGRVLQELQRCECPQADAAG